MGIEEDVFPLRRLQKDRVQAIVEQQLTKITTKTRNERFNTTGSVIRLCFCYFTMALFVITALTVLTVTIAVVQVVSYSLPHYIHWQINLVAHIEAIIASL